MTMEIIISQQTIQSITIGFTAIAWWLITFGFACASYVAYHINKSFGICGAICTILFGMCTLVATLQSFGIINILVV